MIGTIWTIEEAQRRHAHSPGLADWLAWWLDASIPVVDLGCGKGTYVKKLNTAGITAWGIEGTPGIDTIADTACITEADITKPLNTVFAAPKRSVLCLEVLEHIAFYDEHKVLENIKSICNNILVLSWAIEGQHGYGHINCRNADYVVPTIEALGFTCLKDVTELARKAATSTPYTDFFNDSLYIFKRKTE